MELDKKALKKMFPNLAKEMESDENKVQVNSVRTDSQTGEKATIAENFTSYAPDVMDFIRRCGTEEQAREIINYMERRSEISKSHAKRLLKQLEEKGVRSFGSKKEEDYYLKHGDV